MSTAENNLINQIMSAFSRNIFPIECIIDSKFNTEYSEEASRVEAYIRHVASSGEDIDRSNSAQVAFIYLTKQASAYIFPRYLVSIIRSYVGDNFINTVVLNVLSQDPALQRYDVYKDLRKYLLENYSAPERACVCNYLKWYINIMSKNDADMYVYGEQLHMAALLWCS